MHVALGVGQACRGQGCPWQHGATRAAGIKATGAATSPVISFTVSCWSQQSCSGIGSSCSPGPHLQGLEAESPPKEEEPLAIPSGTGGWGWLMHPGGFGWERREEVGGTVTQSQVSVPQAGLPRRLCLQPPGAAPEGEAAQRETATAPEVPAEPVQLLHLHPQPLLPLGRR